MKKIIIVFCLSMLIATNTSFAHYGIGQWPGEAEINYWRDKFQSNHIKKGKRVIKLRKIKKKNSKRLLGKDVINIKRRK